MPEETEYPHHHHHHHHHSSPSQSSGGDRSSPGVRVQDIGDYSLRTFGRKCQTSNNQLPDGALSIIVFSVVITALVLAPVIITLMFRNKTLGDANERLRARLGVLMSQLEEGGEAPREQPRQGHARYIDEDLPDEPSKPQERQDQDTAAHTPTPPDLDSIARALDMTKADLNAIKEEMELFPNGMRFEIDDEGGDALVADPLARNIANALTLYFLGQKTDAAALFRMVSGAKPLWPYGHFFLGVATGDRAEMERANLLFSAARALGALPPEGEIYRAACSLFLGNAAAATTSIERAKLSPPDDRELQIGRIPVPSTASAQVVDMMRSLCGTPNVKEAEW